MNGSRESDADFGKTLRHGRTLAAYAAALVLATSGVISAAYAMASNAGDAAAERTFASEEHRERMQNIADAAVDRKVARPLTALEVEVRQLREVLQRVENYTRPPTAPRKRAPSP
jgi:hypothetical protein